MTIDNYGNVGIGTTAPSYRLAIEGASGTSQVLNIRNPDASWSQYALIRAQADALDTRFVEFGYYRGTDEASRAFVVRGQSSNTLLTILESSGTVGIGTTSPSTRLHVAGVTTLGGNAIFAADNTYDIGASGATRPRAGYFGTNVVIGASATPSGVSTANPRVFGVGTNWTLIGADNVTDVTTKVGAWGIAHYTNTEEPVTLVYGSSTVSGSGVNIGGGLSNGNSATLVSIYTAADNTTLTGTQRWYWNYLGHYIPAADNTYDFGSSSNQIRDAYLSRSVIISQAAIPAGGVAGRGLSFSSTTNFGVFFGSGAPTLSAAKGSLYLRSDGSGTGDRMYVNTDGSTAWTAVTTAA
jgi:hypothetical protein